MNKKYVLACCVLLLGFLCATRVLAHQLNMAVLHITEVNPLLYQVYFKFSGAPERLNHVTLKAPDDCKKTQTVRQAFQQGSVSTRLALKCTNPLRIQAQGLLPSEDLFYVNYENLQTGQNVSTMQSQGFVDMRQLKEKNNKNVELRDENNGVNLVTYGFYHILIGMDHVLVVICFVGLCGLTRSLLWAITGFTLGHSLTLIAATKGWLLLPIAPTEAVIALSVVFLARELWWRKTSPYFALIAVMVGLLHGLGFASALTSLNNGAGADQIVNILFFNVGIELGQLMLIVLMAGSGFLFKKNHLRVMLQSSVVKSVNFSNVKLQRWSGMMWHYRYQVMSLWIGGIASYFFLQRTISWFS